MIPPVIIKIYGGVNTGKTTWVHAIRRKAKSLGLSVEDYDSLYSFQKGFNAKFNRLLKGIRQRKPDFAIISIGTGDNRDFRIEIEHDGFVAEPLFNVLFAPDLIKPSNPA